MHFLNFQVAILFFVAFYNFFLLSQYILILFVMKKEIIELFAGVGGFDTKLKCLDLQILSNIDCTSHFISIIL